MPYLVRTLGKNIHEIETLEQDRRIIEEMIINPDASEYTKKVKVTESVMVDIEVPNRFSTKCTKCEVVCHYPCDIQSSNYICKSSWWCAAMTRLTTSVHCTICPGKYSWTDHIQITERQAFITHPEKRTNVTLKQHYMQDMKVAIELGKKTCEYKMISAYDKLLKDFKEI